MTSTQDLFGKREQYINKSISEFRQRHPGVSWVEIEELRKKLEAEAVRVYPMINESIVKERKKRAISTFGIAVFLGVIFAILTGGTLLAPIVGAAITAFTSVATTDVSYNARVKGAFDSVTAVHEQGLQQRLLDARSNSEDVATDSSVAVRSGAVEVPRQSFVEREGARRRRLVHAIAA